ncbi:hypothetical protein IAT38_004961 [Cryptococcus sp. DSM 104549]
MAKGQRSSVIMPKTFRGLLDIFNPSAAPPPDASKETAPPPPPQPASAPPSAPASILNSPGVSRSASPAPYSAATSPERTAGEASSSATPSTTRSSSLSGPPVTATPPQANGRSVHIAPQTVIVEPEEAGGSSRPRKESVGSGVSGGSARGERELRAWRRRNPLDTYIIVKPPASSSKSIPNLQIQLVVKPPRRTSATPSSAASSSSHADAEVSSDAGASIERRRSGSASSTWSFATTASGAGGAEKRIEPMFNLSVHNVVQSTVVTDAVTDAKVAKFRRQTLDITGVGTLEPLELQRELLKPPPDDPPPPTYAPPTFGLSPLLTVLPALPLSTSRSRSPFPSPPNLTPASEKQLEIPPPSPAPRRSGSRPRSRGPSSRGPSSEHPREPELPRTARVGYTWTVRKWAPAPKRWAARVGVALGKEGDGEDDVVFEWSPPSSSGAGGASDGESGDNDEDPGRKTAGRAASTWRCTVRVGSSEPRLLATLAPAKHAKALALLKIPMALEPVKGRDMAPGGGGLAGLAAGVAGGIAGLATGKTREGSSGSAAGGVGAGPGGTVLSEENLKDVICVTGLWLVVREGFGGEGLGKRDSH